MNATLADKIKDVFKTLGIIGYSRCCRLGCTGSYDERDDEFIIREKGICYFKLFLSGMNYDQHPQKISVVYDDFQFLMQNWDDEKALVDRWCDVIGLKNGDYSVEKPDSVVKCIIIRLNQPLNLEECDYSDEDEEEEKAEEKLNKTQIFVVFLVFFVQKKCCLSKTIL